VAVVDHSWEDETRKVYQNRNSNDRHRFRFRYLMKRELNFLVSDSTFTPKPFELYLDLYHLCNSLLCLDTFWARGLSSMIKKQQQQPWQFEARVSFDSMIFEISWWGLFFDKRSDRSPGVNQFGTLITISRCKMTRRNCAQMWTVGLCWG